MTTAALWFAFWDWDSLPAAQSAAAATALASSGGSGKGSNDDFPIDYDELWALRESYLRSLYGDPAKRQRAMEKHGLVLSDVPTPINERSVSLGIDTGWPDAILKPRRKR